MGMTRTDLLEIIRNGENSGVEFKRDVVQNQALAKELVAFANFGGGIVLLGVEDDGSISGLTRDDPEMFVMNTCRDKVRPALIPFYEVVKDVEPGKDVAVVRVARGFDVHTLWHETRSTYFIRVGTQSREPTPEELGRLFQQRGTFRAELRPVSGVTFADLDIRRLKNYFARVRQQDIPDDNDEAAWATLLFNTEIMVEDGITVSGVLLFGRTPNRFLPQAGIDGPMTPLLSDDGEIVEAGLVEQALAFVKRNVPVAGQLEDGGARREDIPAYPIEAVREAIVNALVHRDYLLSGTDVELSIYEDRMEVISPGRLPNGITPRLSLPGAFRDGRSTQDRQVHARTQRHGAGADRRRRALHGAPRSIVRRSREGESTDSQSAHGGPLEIPVPQVVVVVG
jgi:ATP-dependent DNA helicase RecG